MKNTKDWTGGFYSTFKTIGASNHTIEARAARDFYATDPRAVDRLLEKQKFNKMIWENACGNGHIAETLINEGYNVFSTDIIQREYKKQALELDFLECTEKDAPAGEFDIITNPPYKYAKEFVFKSMEILKPNCRLALFLKLTFLESEGRRDLFCKYPPQKILVFSKRVNCAKNGNEKEFETSSAVCYAWFIWQKGSQTPPQIDWI